MLDMLRPEQRCTHCFREIDFLYQTCPFCRTKESSFHKVAAAFDYCGPAETLVKKMKYGNKPYLSEGMAAFMAAQFFNLNWPIPDIITSVPISPFRNLDRGYNQSRLIAEGLSHYIGSAYQELIYRQLGGYSQAGLNPAQRKSMPSNPFYLKKGVSIPDKCILLIDDVMTTGTTLEKCADALHEGYPAAVYALTFCKA